MLDGTVQLLNADLIYIDPPYNSRQYSDTYHLLENVACWQEPPVHGVARKMNRNKLNSNSNARISDKNIFRILNDKGDVEVFAKEYKPFTTGRSDIRGNEERLFLCKVHRRNRL